MRRLALLALIVLAIAGCSSKGFDREHSTFTPETLHEFDEFPLYWLGDRFESGIWSHCSVRTRSRDRSA